MDLTNAALLAQAAAGDQGAWDVLVDRYGRLVWHVVRGFRLDDGDAHDAVQTTWLRLVEHLDGIRDAQALPGWLATTARRECLRQLRHRGRTQVADDTELDLVDAGPPVDDALLREERDRALWRAFATLRERCRTLLLLLMADPPQPYAAIVEALAIPVGSIGPTRARCLAQLQAALVGTGITAAPAGSGEA